MRRRFCSVYHELLVIILFSAHSRIVSKTRAQVSIYMQARDICELTLSASEQLKPTILIIGAIGSRHFKYISSFHY